MTDHNNMAAGKTNYEVTPFTSETGNCEFSSGIPSFWLACSTCATLSSFFFSASSTNQLFECLLWALFLSKTPAYLYLTRIQSEKCVSWRFHCCVNIKVYNYVSLDGIIFTPRLFGLVYWTTIMYVICHSLKHLKQCLTVLTAHSESFLYNDSS